MDYKSLKYLKTTKTSLKCLAHWVSEFTEYNLNIKYHKDLETVHRPDFMRKIPVNWAKKLWLMSF